MESSPKKQKTGDVIVIDSDNDEKAPTKEGKVKEEERPTKQEEDEEDRKPPPNDTAETTTTPTETPTETNDSGLGTGSVSLQNVETVHSANVTVPVVSYNYSFTSRQIYPLPLGLPVLHSGSNLDPGKYKRYFTFHGTERVPDSTREGEDFIKCFLTRLDKQGDVLSFRSRSLVQYEDSMTYRRGIPDGLHLVRLDVYYIKHPEIRVRRVFTCQIVQTFILYAAGCPTVRITMSERKIHLMEPATVSGYLHFGTREIEDPSDSNQVVVACTIAMSPIGQSGVTTFYPHP